MGDFAMFGLRNDGKRIKTIDPVMKMVPHIMKTRNDAQVMALYEIDCKGLDEYIFAKRHEENIRFTYMHILIAAFVRVMALRPKLNRFIVNGRVFKRNEIQISFAVKKTLLDTAEETTIKLTFDGTESIYDVKKKIDDAVLENAKESAVNGTDKMAKLLTIVPNGLIKILDGFLMWLDKHGLLPKKVLEVSPFHTSLFLTNMKSIKMGYVYHHCYNFGSTSIFVSMGKEKYEPVILDADDAKFGVAKIMKVGVVVDERICDGLYYGNSLREFKKYMEYPTVLEERIDHKIEDQK